MGSSHYFLLAVLYVVISYPKYRCRVVLNSGISISIGVVFLLAISYASYKVINQAIARRRRMRYFKRNGGQLLEQQEKSDPSSVVNITMVDSFPSSMMVDSFHHQDLDIHI
uniref:Uncharacterized protein n=1 Tax=Lactuca sativa TaxID=4236 RepID=A0A9R1WET7_LACSA|nr:hypothetical protein LSAT_V11C200072540 [Lactuca sativa]